MSVCHGGGWHGLGRVQQWVSPARLKVLPWEASHATGTGLMDKHLLKRRQLLWYVGLGALGFGATALVSGGPAAIARHRHRTLASAAQRALTPLVEARRVGPGTPLPEFQGIRHWLNSAPLQVADLKGSVVLIQFWTYACINSQRTLPYVIRWHQQYADQGLKVVGIHAPEFAFEHKVDNVSQALVERHITYPVALDNDYTMMWKTYRNRYWPRLYLASREGIISYDHIGEGAYAQTEQTIQRLLG